MIDTNSTIVAYAWGIALSIYSMITHSIVVFICGVTVGVVLDAGVKYIVRAIKYEKGDGRNGRKE